MKFNELRQFTNEEHDEILDALALITKEMKVNDIEAEVFHYSLGEHEKGIKVDLDVVDDDIFSVNLARTVKGQKIQLVGFTLTKDDDNSIRISDGSLGGEPYDFEALGHEYKIVECFNEMTNLCQELG